MAAKLSRFKNNKYLIFALLFAVLNMAAVFFIFGFQQYGDTVSYIEAINWLQGKSVSVDPWIVLKPLGVLLALPFEFLGEGAGLIVQNIVFYLLCSFLIFKIVDLVYDNKKIAFLASLFFVTATQVLEVGLAYLTDMGAWFFYLLSIFLTLLYLKKRPRAEEFSSLRDAMRRFAALLPLPTRTSLRGLFSAGALNEKLIFLNGFLSGLGVLMKENGGLGILFFGLMILLAKDFAVREKISKIFKFGIFFLIPIILWQVFMYKLFQVTSLDWYLFQLSGFSHGQGGAVVVLKYFGQLFRTLGILWIFFFIGLWLELKRKDWQRLKIYLALLPASFSFFLWPISAGGRSVFIFAPLGILLTVYGCKKTRPFILALIILLVLALNYWFVSVNQQIPFVDIIYNIIQ